MTTGDTSGSTNAAGTSSADDRLQQLIRMAIEAETIDERAGAAPARAIADAAGEPVIARIGPTRVTESTAPSADEIERLVRVRMGQLPKPERTRARNGGLWTGMVAASICLGTMLWVYRGATPPQGNTTPTGPIAGAQGSATTPDTRPAAPTVTQGDSNNDIVAPPGFDRPLADRRERADARLAARPAGVTASAVQLVSSVPVFVVLKGSAGDCGCAHLLPEQLATGWTAPAGARVLYARAEQGTPSADRDSFPVRGQPLSASDFACFHANFATSLSQSIRGDASAPASCDGSTTGPMLQASDFLCFTSKFAAGCM